MDGIIGVSNNDGHGIDVNDNNANKVKLCGHLCGHNSF